MGFMDSYKRLEKLCGEILGKDRPPVSAYIDEMKSLSNGSLYVRNWEEDLKNLKHYRWVRNQISHEPGCSEENMCEPEDARWLDRFYSRIMNQTDPLALYRKTRSAAKRPRHRSSDEPMDARTSSRTRKRGRLGLVLFWMSVILVIFVLLLLYRQF